MSSKLWMITPAVAFATAALLAFVPGDMPRPSAEAPANCVKLASADTGIMSDASDACIFSVAEAKAETGCSKSKAREMTAAALRPRLLPAIHRMDADVTSLEWPADFVALTTGAAATVWDSTIGFLGDLYDFAERKAAGLWV